MARYRWNSLSPLVQIFTDDGEPPFAVNIETGTTWIIDEDDTTEAETCGLPLPRNHMDQCLHRLMLVRLTFDIGLDIEFGRLN